MRRFCFLLLLLSIALLAGCGGEGGSDGAKSDDATANLLTNPGFENGAEPWHPMKGGGWSSDFAISDSVFHGGSHSVHLQFVPPAQPSRNKIFGVVQDVPVAELPEYLSGYYRVENWRKGTDYQYLQFVVIVFTTNPQTGETSNTQIRYLLAGAASEPFEIDNAKFVFIDKAEPRQGAWVRFGRNIRDDFQQEWGSVPENITSVRIFFEARFDSPAEIQPQMAGDVYFDDLYMGPQSKAPPE